MTAADIIQAWKDVDYRLSLDPHQQAMLPPHPAGEIEQDLEETWLHFSMMTASMDVGCPPGGDQYE